MNALRSVGYDVDSKADWTIAELQINILYKNLDTTINWFWGCKALKMSSRVLGGTKEAH